MSELLLLLGAGASIPQPTGIPGFDALATGIFSALGWHPTARPAAGGGPGPDEPRWERPGQDYPTIGLPRGRIPPEVLFGTLRMFGVPFEDQLRRLLGRLEPNAAHYAAARVLQQGGAVWTTNVDLAVEEAHERAYAGAPLHRAANVPAIGPAGPVAALGEASGSSLVKFHGSLDVAGSLAFTDRQLLAPLDPEVVGRLAGTVAGRRVAVIGYAAADADLHPLFRRVLGAAPEVRWFEPTARGRAGIAATLPGVPLVFDPDELAGDADFRGSGGAFLRFAEDRGLLADIPPAVLEGYFAPPPPGQAGPVFSFSPHPPAIVHARLVQRFGDAADEERALAASRREELAQAGVSARAALPYARWAFSRSLYGGGAAARAVDRAAGHLGVLGFAPLRTVRDLVVSRQCALLLQAGDWQRLESFADQAIARRVTPAGQPVPSDL